MSWPFLFTITGLLIYCISSYRRQSTLQWIHACYILFLIVRNCGVTQSDDRFVQLHPGTVAYPGGKQAPSECKVCKKVKPPRYYHCRRCNLCIYQMDHHCEWLNCCVGQFNFKVYLHILVNLFALGSRCLLETIFMEGDWLNATKILSLLASIFLLWQVFRVASGLIEMVIKNQTLIETYKRVRGNKKGAMEKLTQLFGRKFGLSWFVPTYASTAFCDVWQKTYPISTYAHVKEMTYADEYLYGTDEQEVKVPHQN